MPVGWNENLYYYAQTHQGKYLGGQGEEWDLWSEVDGMLMMEYRGAPLVVSCRTSGGGRGGISYAIQAMLGCTLEERYQLKISPKNVARPVMALVDGSQDLGCPELTRQRSIKTDHREFTKMILRDPTLRRLLLTEPRFELRVEPSSPRYLDGLEHTIYVECSIGGSMSGQWAKWEMDMTDARLMTPQQQREFLEKSSFVQRLDALLALSRAAYDAVTVWRMPSKKD